MRLACFMAMIATYVYTAPVLAAPPDAAEIVRRALPAVVSIEARWAPASAPPSGFGVEFDKFFGTEHPRDDRSVGSGLVIDAAQGLIITTDYVIGDASNITVTTASGDLRGARIVAVDPLTGVAVLQVSPGGLSTLPFASGLPEIGDPAIAIGQAYGFGVVATRGIVSLAAADLSDALAADYPDGVILADVAIHLGMGGGPLLNADGEVIGIATAAFGASGNPQANLGVALPIGPVRSVVETVIAGKPLTRGWIGIRFDPGSGKRISVTDVAPDSPAARAGMEAGDMITAVDGVPLTAVALSRRIAQSPAGTPIRIDLERPRPRGGHEQKRVDVLTIVNDVPTGAAPR